MNPENKWSLSASVSLNCLLVFASSHVPSSYACLRSSGSSEILERASLSIQALVATVSLLKLCVSVKVFGLEGVTCI